MADIRLNKQQKKIRERRQHRGASNAIAAANQYLPEAAGGLGINQIACVFRLLCDDAWMIEQVYKRHVNDYRAALVMMLCFGFRISSQQGTGLNHLHKVRRYEQPSTGGVRCNVAGRKKAVVLIGMTGILGEVPRTGGEPFQSTESDFVLAVPKVLDAPVKQLLRKSGRYTALFDAQVLAGLPLFLRELCKEASRIAFWRVTPHRLLEFFPRLVLSDERIPPEQLAYWQGRLIRKQAAAIHYRVLDIEGLGRKFQQLWYEVMIGVYHIAQAQGFERLLDGCFDLSDANAGLYPADHPITMPLPLQPCRDRFKPFEKVSPDQLSMRLTDDPEPPSKIAYECQSSAGRHVGTARMIRSTRIKTAVTEIKKALLDDNCNTEAEPLQRRFNLFLFYSVLKLLLGSGLRPNKNLITTNQWLPDYHLAFVNDKGVIRPLFCQREVIDQLHDYRFYLQALRSRTAYTNIPLAQQLNQILDTQTDRGAPFLYWLDEQGILQPVTRQWLDQMCEHWLGVAESYVCRRFIRNYLAEAGVSAAMLGTFMGHHERGNGVGNSYSLTSLEGVAYELSQHTQRLLTHLGFERIHWQNGRFEVAR